MTPRWILANLDCEDDWARLRAPDKGRWPRSLPLDVLHRVSVFGTLLRVYAQEGDTLWTPAPVEPACLREVPGLPPVRLVHGPDAKVPTGTDVVAWADAPPKPIARERLEAAARVNDRAFALRLTERFGVALPGSEVVRSVEELLATEVVGGAWIAKAPHGAAGRNRVRGAGRRLEENQRGALANLLREHGRLIVQPWVDRTLDFGLWFDPQDDDTWVRGAHELEVDDHGRFTGVLVTPDGPPVDAPAYLHTIGDLVRDHLEGAGYHGPFGIDGWEYQSATGARMLMPLGEINARRTFGMVAHELAERVGWPHFGRERGGIALRFGRREDPQDPSACLPLLGKPGAPTLWAWLEPVSPPRAREPDEEAGYVALKRPSQP